ncbi:hypothetical protein UCDDA912_g08142 [Diaporthe ampelina]|uniref:Uncharacterized protein n=1 Tax=Diaporthe ampelina TaxID=1214573 RepID=A0A0G2H9E4_9PEZI|nr:hypothetical protein UCDDA912_g08142 [Diaporthe ampelina]
MNSPTDEEGHANPEKSPLSASLLSKKAHLDHPIPGLTDPATQEAPRDIDDKPLEKDSEGQPVSQNGDSDSSSDAYIPPDYDDDGSELGSPVYVEDLDEELDRPPIGGETAADEKARALEIVDEVRVKDDGGAQIVVCRVSGEKDEVVAKIYDPLYYGFADRMWSDRPRDVTYQADMDYAREVAAYSELDSQLGGTDIPKYHGSWTFQLPLDLPDGQKTRHVRLVLMEHIKGRPMTDLEPESFPEPTRLELVTRMIEVVARVQFAGVRHGDISQRNVMVCLAEPDVVERVALIDFNFAVVSRLDNFEEQFRGLERGPKPDKLPSPIDRWWGGALYGVAGEWLPKSWELRLRALQEWLYERYSNSDEYAPPTRALKWDQENLPRSWIGT